MRTPLACLCALSLIGVTPVGAQTFLNSAPIIIPASGSGPANSNPYPSSIVASGLSSSSKLFRLRLYGFSHTYQADLDIALVDLTNSRGILLTTDLGGSSDLARTDVIFGDDLPNFFGSSGDLGAVAVAYKPEGFSSPGFSGPLPSSLTFFDTFAAFTHTDPNATYGLYIYDDAGQDVGQISDGWLMAFAEETTATPEPASVLLFGTGLLAVGMLRRRRRAS